MTFYTHKITGERYESRDDGVYGSEPYTQPSGWFVQPVVNLRLGTRVVVQSRFLEPDLDPTVRASGPADFQDTTNPPPLDGETEFDEDTMAEWGEDENGEQPWNELVSEKSRDPRADWVREQIQRENEIILSAAELLPFNLGNALLAMHDGDLNIALEAVRREHARRYPAAEPAPEEAHRD